MNKSHLSLKIALFSIYFLLLVLVSGKLFFEQQFDAVAVRLKAPFQTVQASSVTIGFADPLISLNPLANDAGSRSRLLHIYEPLVRVTKDLQTEPALAISYGLLSDLTWEFRLRPGVKFHNGALLAIEDVIFSLEEAGRSPSSDVKDLASTIKEIKKIDDQVFQIATVSPDPLLLQKISAMLIFPRNLEGSAIGTGPYKLAKKEDGVITLKRFGDYWGALPAIESATLKTFAKKEEKIAALKNREVDILANLPADIGTVFGFPGFELQTAPSLEFNFLMFGFDGVFKRRELREAVCLALEKGRLAKLAQGFAVQTDQFVGNGIFGYDPSIKKHVFDPAKALELVRASGQEGVKAALDLPKGLEVFGADIAEQLKKTGIELTLNLLPPADLGRKIMERKSEFFFFGWKNDLGDSADFLTAVVHSPTGNFGHFNGGNYANPEVDALIEQSQQTVKADVRLLLLRSVMNKITVDDVIGLPLFSPEVLYGVSNKVNWTPRVDGHVLAQEIKM